jgi:CheY-like chemotaxis protein
LQKEGWTVTEAETEAIAFECMERDRPSVILVDLMTPEMDGFEFVQRVRQNRDWRLIPIIMVTAKELTQEERRRLNGSVETILHKVGSSREELLDQVRNLLADCAIHPKKEETARTK